MADFNAELQEQSGECVRPISPITLALAEGKSFINNRETTVNNGSESDHFSANPDVNNCKENKFGAESRYSSESNAERDGLNATLEANKEGEVLATRYALPNKISKEEEGLSEGDKSVGDDKAANESSKDDTMEGVKDDADGMIFSRRFVSLVCNI